MADQKPKRPADMNKLAKSIVDIATGQDDDTPTFNEKRASKAGKVGGAARAAALTAAQRSEIASIAAQARWKKSKN